MTDHNDADEWVEVGHLAVDAGCIMLMDPSYAFGGDRYDETVEGDWRASKQLDFRPGHPGLGVLVNSGFGDGFYPVSVRMVDVAGWGRRVAEVRVTFISDDDLEDVDNAAEDDHLIPCVPPPCPDVEPIEISPVPSFGARRAVASPLRQQNPFGNAPRGARDHFPTGRLS